MTTSSIRQSLLKHCQSICWTLLCLAVCREAAGQAAPPSVLKISQTSSFFSEQRAREPIASVVRSMEQAVAAGASVDEADPYGSTAFWNVLGYAVTNSEGAQANPIVKALIRLGADVNRPMELDGGKLYPVCAPLLWGTLNNELLAILLNAGATRTIRCYGQSLDELAVQQTINPKLREILQRHQ
jgi:hypothetical protein